MLKSVKYQYGNNTFNKANNYQKIMILMFHLPTTDLKQEIIKELLHVEEVPYCSPNLSALAWDNICIWLTE